MWKVGVTRLWRLETRLREQGADRAAHIRTYPDGQIAREVEAELAERDNLVDRVRVPTKLRDSVAAWTQRRGSRCWTGSIRSSGSRSITASTSTTVPSRRRWRPGRSEAGRGVLVLDRGGSTYAVDARDLVGYELTEEVPDRELQSSLGAFGG